MSSRHDKGWDKIYHRYRPEFLPWEHGKPRRVLVELVDSGRVVPSKTLDLCCGVGSNTVYLAKKGFDVAAIDISDKAVEYARDKAHRAKVNIHFLVGDFLNLPFRSEEFRFAFDFGCFHHVEVKDRINFIKGVCRVLRPESTFFLVCFSYKNGPAWNHFTKGQIVGLFKDYFEIESIKHVSSIEADKIKRYFYEVLMEKSID
jgi:ubiquinone/menaquinone biosynthesis C-methylase UbiE